MNIIEQLKILLTSESTHDLSLEDQCKILEQTNPEYLTGQDLYQVVEYLYEVTHAPKEIYNAIDIVGTGGDGLGLFNISTTSSFVIAGSGIPVLKHGNVSVSSCSGSMDCLKALSIPLSDNLPDILQQFKKQQLTFLFAAQFYPILNKIRDARKKLALEKKYTIFNILGPLLNPLRPSHQLIGVSKKAFIPIMSEALFLLKRQAFVFCCHNTDEIIPGNKEDMAIIKVNESGIENYEFNYKNLKNKTSKSQSIQAINTADLVGGNPEENAQILLTILDNKLMGPMREVVIINTAFAVMLYHNISFETAYNIATESLNSGAAFNKFNEVKLP